MAMHQQSTRLVGCLHVMDGMVHGECICSVLTHQKAPLRLVPQASPLLVPLLVPQASLSVVFIKHV